MLDEAEEQAAFLQHKATRKEKLASISFVVGIAGLIVGIVGIIIGVIV
jgi:preprotein translocase subunit Sss1